MSANDSESDLSNFLLDRSNPKKQDDTASNAVNTEELLASLSMLNLTGNEESAETNPKDEVSEVGESENAEQPPAQKEAAEPMHVIGKDQHLSQLFNRVQSLLKGDADEDQGHFIPRSPETLEETGLTQDEIERLILKYLLAKGTQTGRQICKQIQLPFGIVDLILKRAKQDQLVAYGGTAEMGDYEFTITELGRERARRFTQECTYFGSAPVCFKDYLQAMAAQSIAKQEATEADLKAAFSDLIINPKMLDRLGPAVNSGRGMFLFGEAGNGKTSIAERITKAFGSTIWVPRCLGIDGDIIRIFDPGLHEEVTQEHNSESLFDLSGVDQRWVQIVRPTVIAGGELTMKELEITQNPQTKICEAPLQLKSNCGTFVIDDFGRQRMPVDELLNRWIVPLEKRYDFLNLPSGKKIQVPFDQLIIFSTNLEPKDLVDAAFCAVFRIKLKPWIPHLRNFGRCLS